MSDWIEARLGVDSRDEEFSGYDVMQVCINGHQITSSAHMSPQLTAKHCADCGAKTIHQCESCQAAIRGHYYVPGVFSIARDPIPDYCHECGSPFPWRAAAIENLNDILAFELSADDMLAASRTFPDVLRETPKTESASLKLKSLLKKLGNSTYEIAIKVITDVASETAKKTMGLDKV